MCSVKFLRDNQPTYKQAGEVFVSSSESNILAAGKVKNRWRGWKSSVWNLDKSGNSQICTVFAGEAVRWNVLGISSRGWGGRWGQRPSYFVVCPRPAQLSQGKLHKCPILHFTIFKYHRQMPALLWQSIYLYCKQKHPVMVKSCEKDKWMWNIVKKV